VPTRDGGGGTGKCVGCPERRIACGAAVRWHWLPVRGPQAPLGVHTRDGAVVNEYVGRHVLSVTTTLLAPVAVLGHTALPSMRSSQNTSGDAHADRPLGA